MTNIIYKDELKTGKQSLQDVLGESLDNRLTDSGQTDQIFCCLTNLIITETLITIAFLLNRTTPGTYAEKINKYVALTEYLE